MEMRNEIYISVQQTRSKGLDITSIMRIPFKKKMGAGGGKEDSMMINEIKNKYKKNIMCHHNIIISPHLLWDSHML